GGGGGRQGEGRTRWGSAGGGRWCYFRSVPVARIFEAAVAATRANGIPHYQRHPDGHGIGLEPYDPSTLNAPTTMPLEPGMVFCVATPYYEHGWSTCWWRTRSR